VLIVVAGEGNIYAIMLFLLWRGINNILGRDRWYYFERCCITYSRSLQ
jgi:hypothetical protein